MSQRILWRGVLGLGLLLGFLGAGAARARADSPRATALGNQVPNSYSLRDLHGNRRPLHDFQGHAAVVLAFLGTDCPVANRYLPTLIELEKQYRSKKVQFLAVYANGQENLDQIAGHAYDHDVPFPVLKDFDQQLADLVGVTRLSTVVVLDHNWVLRYRGRINDRYGVAFQRTTATRSDLVQALEEVLGGKPVSVPETEADGCLLDRGPRPVALPGVTYTKQVARILQQHCQVCHHPQQLAPFSLLTYEEAVQHGPMIKEVTAQRRMPPWHADPRYGHFANDWRLTTKEINTLATWVDAGMPRGEDHDLPKAIPWPDGWVHGQPDVVLTMPEEFEVPAEGVVPIMNWDIDTNFTEDKWVQVSEGRPGDARVVHHIIIYLLSKAEPSRSKGGEFQRLGGWAPGFSGLVCPPDSALRLPRGARLRFQVHYTPMGTATKDRSSVGLTFAKKPPRYELCCYPFGRYSFVVPPQDPHYRAEAAVEVCDDVAIVGFFPHMHWRGQDFSYEVIYPDGHQETLLSVPRWDFNWQTFYEFQEPLHLPRGARLHAVAHWDNSPNNPLNPDPGQTVRFGNQAWDEMMFGNVFFLQERREAPVEGDGDWAGPFRRLDSDSRQIPPTSRHPGQSWGNRRFLALVFGGALLATMVLLAASRRGRSRGK